MGKKKNLMIVLVFMVSILHGFNVYGEDSDDPKETEKSELETMTVTAQKIEEDPQQVPISMDVFSDTQIEDDRIENTPELIRFCPNILMKSSPFENQIVIRGVSFLYASPYAPAGYFVDGVAYPVQFMQNNEFYDIERIEVLKGPQGTLYGRNTESGAINIISQKPDNRFKTKAYGEYGNYNSIRAGANISGPVVDDTLYMGGAVLYRSSDGYVTNEYNGDDKAGEINKKNGRATIRWTPTDQWDISLIADAMEADDHAGYYRYVTGPYATDPHKTNKDDSNYLKENGNSQILQVGYGGDAIDVKSITGVLYRWREKYSDSDLSTNPKARTTNRFQWDLHQYSQELRFSSAQGGPFQWLGGLYGFIEKTHQDHNNEFVLSGKAFKHPIADIDTKGYAVFGQGTYTLFDDLHLTAGLRFDHQDLEGDVYDPARNVTCNDDLRYDELLPKFTASYDLSEAAMVYASASKGYMTGGFNVLLKPTQDTFTYDPEYTWNYETGVKTTWFDGKLMANMSVFYIDIKDKQVMNIINPATRDYTISNAAKAHSQGFELQFQANPVRDLDLFGGFGYADATFDDYRVMGWNPDYTGLVMNNFDGNSMPYAPKYTYNVGAHYRFSMGVYARAELFGTDKFYGEAANLSEQKAYELVNFRIGYQWKGFDLCLWVDNVFDTEYLTTLNWQKNGIVGVDGPPRTLGAKLTWRY